MTAIQVNDNPERLATHEAGHSAMQWFVGWGPLLEKIQIRIVGGLGSDPRMFATPPTSAELLQSSVVKSRLLVLFAGAVVSDIRYSTDNAEFRDDWIEILFAARVHLGLTTSSWNPKDRWSVPHMPDVNRLVQEARKKTSEVVQTDGIASAIDAVKDALLESRPNSDGLRTLPGEEVVGLCVEACGAEFPQDNQWRRWIDGTDIAAAE